MILAHPLAGFSVTAICKSFWKNLTPNQERIIWITGVTASILPDLDLSYAFLTKSASHHQYITHTPIFYLTLCLIATVALFIIEKRYLKYNQKTKPETCTEHRRSIRNPKNNQFHATSYKLPATNSALAEQIEFLERLIIVFLANTLVHLLMDIPAGSIRPFWPVYTEIINVFKIQSANWLRNYFSSPAIFIEIFWGVSAIIIATRNWKKKDLKHGLLITFFWFSIAVLSTLLLIN